MRRYCLICGRDSEEEKACPRCDLPLICRDATVWETRHMIYTISVLLDKRLQRAMRETYPQEIIRPAQTTHSTWSRWLRGIYGMLALLAPGLGALKNMWITMGFGRTSRTGEL